MNNPTDRELEEYLKGDSKLSKLYQGDNHLMPPSLLDKAILAESRKAVKSHQSKKKTSWLSSLLAKDWLTPVTSFAMISLMAVGVYMLLVPNNTTTPNGSLAGSTPLKKKSRTDNESKEVHQAVPVTSTSSSQDNETSKLNTPVAKGSQPYSRKSPKQWLKHIKALYENKNTDTAQLEFEKFRKVYPKYPARKVIGKSKVLELDPMRQQKTLRNYK